MYDRSFCCLFQVPRSIVVCCRLSCVVVSVFEVIIGPNPVPEGGSKTTTNFLLSVVKSWQERTK